MYDMSASVAHTLNLRNPNRAKTPEALLQRRQLDPFMARP